MKTLPLVPQFRRGLKGMLVSVAVALLLVAGLFLTSVFLSPLGVPVHALNAPSAAASRAPSSSGVTGTLASFTALIPEMVWINLPIIVH